MSDCIVKDDKLYCGQCEGRLHARLENDFKPEFYCIYCKEAFNFLATPKMITEICHGVNKIDEVIH
jgi:hypothetical protein